jgi:PiT family inorganic phosphate transporter
MRQPAAVGKNTTAVGAAKRFNALKWTVVERMIWAWLLTIPITGTIAFLLMEVLQAFGYGK